MRKNYNLTEKQRQNIKDFYYDFYTIEQPIAEKCRIDYVYCFKPGTFEFLSFYRKQSVPKELFGRLYISVSHTDKYSLEDFYNFFTKINNSK